MANEYVTTTNTIEVLGAPASNINVTTNTIEILGAPNSNAQVSSFTIQVLRSVADEPEPPSSNYIEITGGIIIAGGITIS